MIAVIVPWIVAAAAAAGLLVGLLAAVVLAFNLAAVRGQLRAERRRNELFSCCMQRAHKLWLAEHPDNPRWPDGAELFAWVAVRLGVDAEIGEEYHENSCA